MINMRIIYFDRASSTVYEMACWCQKVRFHLGIPAADMKMITLSELQLYLAGPLFNRPLRHYSARSPHRPPPLSLPLLHSHRNVVACCSAPILPQFPLPAVPKLILLLWGVGRWLACDRGSCGVWARRGWPA